MLAAELLTEPCSSLSFLSVVSISPSPQVLSNCAFLKGPSLGLISIFNYISLQTSSNFCEAWAKLQMEACGPPYFMSHSDSILYREGPATKSLDPWSTYPHPLHLSPKTCGPCLRFRQRHTSDIIHPWEDRPRKRLASALKRDLVPFGQWIPESRREHIGCGWACPLGHVDMGGAGRKPDWGPL